MWPISVQCYSQSYKGCAGPNVTPHKRGRISTLQRPSLKDNPMDYSTCMRHLCSIYKTHGNVKHTCSCVSIETMCENHIQYIKMVMPHVDLPYAMDIHVVDSGIFISCNNCTRTGMVQNKYLIILVNNVERCIQRRNNFVKY